MLTGILEPSSTPSSRCSSADDAKRAVVLISAFAVDLTRTTKIPTASRKCRRHVRNKSASNRMVET